MRIRAAAPHHPRAWDVEIPAGTTLGTIAQAVGLRAADAYRVNGRVVGADVDGNACGLRPGATIDHADCEVAAALTPVAGTPRETVELVAVAGPATGQRWPLIPGDHHIGRHPSADIFVTDPDVCGLHAQVHVDERGTVRLQDRSGDAGIWLGERRMSESTAFDFGSEFRVGATTLRVVPVVVPLPVAALAPAVAGEAGPLWNRPPRAPRPAVEAPPLVPQHRERRSPTASGRNLVAMLVPTLTAAVVAAALRPEMLIFALVAPFGAVASWLLMLGWDRREATKTAVHERREYDAYLVQLEQHRTQLRAQRAGHHLDPPALAKRVALGDARLWERRSGHDDFMLMSPGDGDVQIDEQVGTLRGARIEIDAREAIGIIGDRTTALGAARALVAQLAVHHGPADVALALWSDDALAWSWLHWLPHLLRCEDEPVAPADTAAAFHQRAGDRGLHLVVVLDANGLPAAWRDPWRELLASTAPRTVSAIVLADHGELLPEQCQTIVDFTGETALVRATTTSRLHQTWTIDIATADALAAALAPLIDPDCSSLDQSLPSSLDLVELLAPAAASSRDALVEMVKARWHASAAANAFCAPIGIDTNGVFELDLVSDGPHGLVAGTTGSGKSELLRTIVMAYAASVDAQRLAFVLVDYKGGSAFDGLSALPHVVDVVTDLDLASARRAVRGLEAEVHRRERALRDHGYADIDAYQRARATRDELVPLPRLVIVVDEFATLGNDLPEFVDALVDIAQRGRSLGVHMILATQRPAGAVKDSIRTNTNLRIALRVLDAADSRDVIDVDIAASIDRSLRGRALMRLGASDVRGLQSAYVSGPMPDRHAPQLVARPAGAPRIANATPRADHARQLDVLAEVIATAHRQQGHETPARPWTDALPPTVSLSELTSRTANERADEALVFGLVDQPHAQRHGLASWRPASGNVLFAGIAGSGTTNALVTLAWATCATPVTARPDVYVIATSLGEYQPLLALSHVGAVIAVDDDERVRRLLRKLCTTIDQRRVAGGDHRTILVLVDGVGALRTAYDTLTGLDTLDALDRVATEGPSVGIHFAFAAEHPQALGHRMDRTIARRVLLRLGDRLDYPSGIARDIEPATWPAGRGVEVSDSAEVQVASADASFVDHAVRHGATDSRRAAGIGVLPTLTAVAALPAPEVIDGVLHLTVGIGDRDLDVCAIGLHPGDHALISGGARSGKTNTLLVLREQLSRSSIATVAIGTHRTRLADAATRADDIGAVVEAIMQQPQTDEPLVVLVDDADAVDDGGALERLVAARRRDVHVIAAARGDRLRGLFRHWTNEVRRCGHGVLLRADDADGELLGVRLPRVAGPQPAGRGYVVSDHDLQLAQVALASVVGEEVPA